MCDSMTPKKTRIFGAMTSHMAKNHDFWTDTSALALDSAARAILSDSRTIFSVHTENIFGWLRHPVNFIFRGKSGM